MKHIKNINIQTIYDLMDVRATSAGSNEHGDYGVVYITKGKLKGKLAYYDDDSLSGAQAIVYLNDPLNERCYYIRRTSFCAPTKEQLQYWNENVLGVRN